VQDLILMLHLVFWELDWTVTEFHVYYAYTPHAEINWLQAVDCDRDICALTKRREQLTTPYGKEYTVSPRRRPKRN
jgi:hypothetical protein